MQDLTTFRSLRRRPVASYLSELVPAMPRPERFNVLSHLSGAVLNMIVASVMAGKALEAGRQAPATGFAAFALCMTATYLASSTYHAARGERRDRLRHWDRAGIFVAIAGFHTANAMILAPAQMRLPVIAVVWSVALISALRELRSPLGGMPNSILPYLVLGWGGLIYWKQLPVTLTSTGLFMAAVTGAAVTLGAVVFRCRFIPRNHEIWHVLVLVGNASILAGWNHAIS